MACGQVFFWYFWNELMLRRQALSCGTQVVYPNIYEAGRWAAPQLSPVDSSAAVSVESGLAARFRFQGGASTNVAITITPNPQ